MLLTRQGPSLVVHTPAKLNLILHILGRRQDGFHDLETLMVSIRLYDTIHFESTESSEIELICRSLPPAGEMLSTGPENLIQRAAAILLKAAQLSRGARVMLWKRIPMEAGLGGGSSDAAATLIALNQLWNLKLGLPRLHELAAELGSDVNFFLNSVPASVCAGRGERTKPVMLTRPLHFVVVKPPTGLSTGHVFREWKPADSSPVTDVQAWTSRRFARSLDETRRALFNDLEIPARRLNPEVDRLLQILSRQEFVWSGMTGSGSACFGLCRTARQARGIAGRLRLLRVGQVFSVSTGV